ncbi:MAG: hypothetical protein JW732_09895 [Dehalococcoidia bacterium]|nr:hypothetical protein [Dehalococcoidia bacterium]
MYIKRHSMQCAYCIPSLTTTAKALSYKNPTQPRWKHNEALTAKLWRWDTYPGHLRAILKAAKNLDGG